jgi:hypothetical protein
MPTNIQTRTCALCERSERDVSFPDWENHPDESIASDPTPICQHCSEIVALACDACGLDGRIDISSDYRMRWRIWNVLRNIRFREQFPDVNSIMDLTSEQASEISRWTDARILDSPITNRSFWNISASDATIIHTEDDCTRCEECVSTCEDCGTLIGNVYQSEMYDTVCYGCSLFRCEECGDSYEEQENATRCCSSGEVHEYSHRPTFWFWRSDENGEITSHFAPSRNELYLGIELETECGSQYWSDFLSDAGEEYGNERFCYGKEDGSLDESGIELVTMPSTMDAFMQRFPWEALRTWNANGARSYWRGTCGMHIHVSRSYFSPTHMWRFVAFQLRNQSLCARLGQRETSGYAEWQTLGDFGTYGNAKLSAVVKGRGANGGRYVAINFQNSDTIELRYFRGNLREDVIRARVEFVDALARFTKNQTAKDVMEGALSEIEFAAFVFANRTRYGNLANWFLANPTMREDA